MVLRRKVSERERALFWVDETWLGKHREAIIDPDLPIVDPHHHLWERGTRYLLDEIMADIDSGHNIRATVFLQCDSMYRADGDPNLAPVGETEFVNGIAAMSASGIYGPARVAAGIVGFAELRLGASVDVVLEAHLRAAGDRFRGIRARSVWDADPTIQGSLIDFPKGLLLDAKFREGYARLSRYNLSFDAWLYHPQIPELADLADAFPDTTVILGHVGAPLGMGVYASRRDEVLLRLAAQYGRICPSPQRHGEAGRTEHEGIRLQSRFCQSRHPGLVRGIGDALATLYRGPASRFFGVSRCMFESIFPSINAP